jgi:hypothetical protein
MCYFLKNFFYYKKTKHPQILIYINSKIMIILLLLIKLTAIPTNLNRIAKDS